MRAVFIICMFAIGGCYTPKHATHTGWPARDGDTIAVQTLFYDTTGLWVWMRFDRDKREADKTDPSCEGYYTRLAKEDIAAGKPFLLCQSGPIYEDACLDSMYEQKYHLRLYDYGCMVFEDRACLMEYNSRVFAYLDSLYGPGWRKDTYHHIISEPKKRKRRLAS